ncbi:hypothetical protein N431DRAFT_354061 [Stipitochalara longipes BDJ]|nr:hypothetical protein N431DRAFT_354061 [Stipitochalara longipes BDJ]
MSGQLRSKQGCWTCRLRKKKCDEGHPLCSLCTSLSITCYGYGPRPEWMDNGERERAVANGIKEIVKHTSRRKTITQHSRQRDHVIRIAPSISNASEESSLSGPVSNRQHDTPPPSDHGSSQEDGIQVMQVSNESQIPQDGDQSVPESSFSIPVEETTLLMHFLDDMFPLQYPMYKPRALEGGRGWLLPLVLRTTPLYHAALSFGAYYRTTTVPTISQSSQVTAKIEQGKHFEICIKALNQYAQHSCPQRKLGIVTTVVQLIFYELFTGDGETWQPHLRAAMSMYNRGSEGNLSGFGLVEKSRVILFEDLTLTKYEPEITEEVTNFRFVFGTLIWLDIVSSITAGSAPHMQHYHSSVMVSNSQTKLEDIMGCKNGVMLQISRLAALYAQKTQALQQGPFDCSSLEEIVDDISREIQSGFADKALVELNTPESCFTTPFNVALDFRMVVTRMFLYAASIYLRLLVQGFHNVEGLDTTISEAMFMLQTQTTANTLPYLVCPLFLVGCVAREEDKEFFRTSFTSPPLLNPLLKHRRMILPILEEIWSKRTTVLGFGWQDCVELTKNLLLI